MKRDLQELFKTCLEEQDVLEIPYSRNIVRVSENTRFKSTYGRCRRKPNGTYEIQIASFLLDDRLDDKVVRSTLHHEIVHTIDGCMNHGKKFMNYLNFIGDCYGLDVSARVSYERAKKVREAGLEPKRNETRYNWSMTCLGCGREWKFKKKNRSIKIQIGEMGGYCTCPYCRTDDFEVKDLRKNRR
jgi:hypothetical protein